MRVRRSLTVLCAVVPLAWAAAGCSDNPGGTVSASGIKSSQEILDPAPGACHRFMAGGVNSVDNQTGMDLHLHVGADCSDPAGHPAFYLPATLATTTVPGRAFWHSFTTVNAEAPVPAN